MTALSIGRSSTIGKPYSEADCAELAVIVLREEFGRELGLPTERGATVFGLSGQISEHQGDFAARTAHPVEGDAVLMRSRGRLNHIGVYCVINGEAMVLHALRNAGQANLHKLRELGLVNLEVEVFIDGCEAKRPAAGVPAEPVAGL